MIKRLFYLLVLQFIVFNFALAQSAGDPTVHYIANEGFMVVSGETKVVFDPLFVSGLGHYQTTPKQMEEALFAGTPPFDGIDAVFVSHHHPDHFSPQDILRLLKEQSGMRLYAPMQAIKAMRVIADPGDEQVFERVTAVELAYKDAPVSMQMKNIIVEAVRIPHAGWPTGRLDIENISWRVTLNETTTVLHMGDADPNDVHFKRDADFWDKRHTHMAFPPYWFFSSKGGDAILDQRIKPDHSVGVHVPRAIPTDSALRPLELRGYDLFTHPGETRTIPLSVDAVKNKTRE